MPSLTNRLAKTSISSQTPATSTLAESPSAEKKSMARPARPERFEDVFQDEIIPRFSNSDFKKFARSRHGLGLREYDIENVSEDYRGQMEEMKLKLLFLWKQRNGRNATPQRIRQLADGFLDHINH